MQDREAVAAHFRQLRIICFAIPSGVVVFAGVVWFLLTSGTVVPSLGETPYMGSLFSLIGLSTVVVAHFFPVLMKAPGRDADDEAVLGWHKASTIVAFALREGGALIALVGVLLTGQMGTGFAVAGLALFTMLLAWPRESQLRTRN